MPTNGRSDVRDAIDLDEAIDAIRMANRRSRRESRERHARLRTKISLSTSLDEWLKRSGADDVS
jgi:hypothetical protein